MKYFKKLDLLVIIILLLIGISIMLMMPNGKKAYTTAEIYYNTRLIKVIELDGEEEYSFRLDDIPDIEFTVYKDKTIAFTDSNCPDKVCIRTGRIGTAGKISACVPNKVYIKIVSANKPNSPDIIIYNKYEK